MPPWGGGRGRGPGLRSGPTAADRAAICETAFLVVRGFFGADETRDPLRWADEAASAPEVPGRHRVYHEDGLTEPGRRVVQRIENFCRSTKASTG